jgi:hypothetical protein
MPERPNYYLLLDLDPSVDDWAVIEKRLQEKKRQWSTEKTMGNPASQRKAQHFLSISRDIEETLKNSEARALEAKEARKEQEQERQTKFKELDESIRVLRASGQCTREQIKHLSKQLGASISEKEIESRIRTAGIPIAEGKRGSGPLPPKERIEATVASRIQANLAISEHTDLYDFLGLNPQSSSKSLREKATEINNEILRIGKTDATSSARKELAGICLALFREEKEKEKYDNSRTFEAMDRLTGVIEVAGRDDSFISLREMDEIVKQARERGVQVDDARFYIEDYARKRRWGIQSQEKLPSEDFKLCGYCLTLAGSSTATRCANCGEPLSLACPQCGAQTPTQDRSCSKCGCHTGDAPVVKALFKEGQRLALEGDLAAALNCIDRALLYWPTWQELSTEKQKIESQRRERETDLRSIEQLVASKKLIEARSALDRFIRSRGHRGVEELQKRVDERIVRAELAMREGEKLRIAGKVEEAIDNYEAALSFCADYDQARQAMASCPPPAPNTLSVEKMANGLRLSWREVNARGAISYRVVRKGLGLPNNDADGTRIGEVETHRLDDIGVESGTPWYYAIYTLRGGVASRTSAGSGPHLVTSDVKNLTTRGGDKEVILNWERPKGCKRVEVWRKNDGVPANPGDGAPMVVSGDSAHDTELINGKSYGYRVVVVFDDPRNPGKEVYTPGVASTAFPVSPPEPVTDLNCVLEGKTVRLNWSPIAGASVQIRQTTAQPNSHPGLIIPLDQADRIGTLIGAGSTGNAQSTITVQGRIYFVPLTVAGGIAVVGNVASLTTVEDVVNLKARAVGRNIVLTWDWPAGIDEAIACFAHDGYPADAVNGHSTRVRITRQEYNRNHCWEVRGAARQSHYFTIFAKTGDSGVCSTGARAFESMGQGISVTYRVVLKRAFMSRTVQQAWLELQCKDRPSLPGLLVVGKQRNVPLSPADGTMIEEVREVFFRDGKAQIQIPQQYLGAPTYVKVFFKDSRDAQEIRLLPAPKEELRLG